jgi:integrase
VVEEMRHVHPEYVFSYRGKPLRNMNNRAWKEGRVKVGLPQVRIHDLKHTFGRRLRAAGVSFEDRQDLLGHKSGRITTHYSMAELSNLIAAADKVCEEKSHKSPTLVILKKKFHPVPHKQLGGTSG